MRIFVLRNKEKKGLIESRDEWEAVAKNYKQDWRAELDSRKSQFGARFMATANELRLANPLSSSMWSGAGNVH
jgi:hypothetical protein